MKMYYVYKEDWCHYSETRGCIVISDSWQRAKGIAVVNRHWQSESKSNIIVKEIDVVAEGVLCATDGIINSVKYN